MNLKNKLFAAALSCCFYAPIFAQQVIPLWPNGAPGFEKLRNEPEQAKDYWVKHINNPSLTVYLAVKEKATGAAVVICPGGGHSLLVIDAEGTEPAKFLNSLGVTAFVLKYRLAREEGSPYNLEKVIKEDGFRAMRLVRSRAAEFGIDPKRIGMMGFSAGGEVVDAIAYQSGTGNPQAKDPIEKASGKSDFDILIYPGPLYVPEVIPADAPPAFLLAADNDPCCAVPVVQLLERYRAAKVPIEAHILAQGSHGFNMGNRSKLASVQTWRQRLADWLEDTNILHPGAHKAE
ncbi:MAG: alpha/beta hydrolase [Sphingobacteriaceae bacterium]|nr:MAG: alpha/beta hydrolase [Sphingobacteriaceae bacterium]